MNLKEVIVLTTVWMNGSEKKSVIVEEASILYSAPDFDHMVAGTVLDHLCQSGHVARSRDGFSYALSNFGLTALKNGSRQLGHLKMAVDHALTSRLAA